MPPDGIIKLKGIGQVHPLRVAIRNFLEGYPRNVGILKEAIQNADDGEGSRVEIVLDRRSYSGPAEMAPLLGPSLLIFNDRPFRAEDFHNIRQLGNSGKLREEART